MFIARKKILVGSLLFLTALLFVSLSLFSQSKSTDVLEKWETKSGKNKIIVTSYAEKYKYAPGAYYVFEIVNDTNEKVEIMSFRHDDPVPINKEGVVFFNEQIIYVFMGWKYAVSQDSGKNWFIWDAEKELAGWKCCNYFLIRDIKLNKDGTGKMFLNDAQNNISTVLVTKDYGHKWIK